MVDVEDADRVGGLVDQVAHPILASTGTPMAVERCSQPCAHSLRGKDKRSGDELPRRDGGSLRKQIGERPSCTRSQDEPVRLVNHGERRDPALA